MHDCLLLFIICAKSLSAYTQPYSPTTFKLQHIHYTHTYEPPERLPPESQIYSSIGGRPVHTWPRNGKMDIQCLKTERIAHGYMECYNEWTDISRWTHSRMASVPFWLWTMDMNVISSLSTAIQQFKRRFRFKLMANTAKLTGPRTFTGKNWVGPVKLMCIIMFKINKIRPKSPFGPVKAPKFSRCL